MDQKAIGIVYVDGDFLVGIMIICQPQVPVAERCIAFYWWMNPEEIADIVDSGRESLRIIASNLILFSQGPNIIFVASSRR